MNVKFDFTETGGLPLDQDILNDMQNGTLLVDKALADLLGPLAIVSGCIKTGSDISNGVVAVNGEILPFVGGVMQAKVIVIETTAPLIYFDGIARPSETTRYATFGDDGIQNNPWPSFKRIRLDRMWLPGDTKEIDCTEAYMNANFDNTGLGINEREGWAICNGNNGTRNRGGLTSVAFDASKVYANELGKVGGEEKHQLTVPELPKHKHRLDKENVGGGVGEVADAKDSGSQGPGGYTAEEGGDEAHNNMQPYIVTLVIQKL